MSDAFGAVGPLVDSREAIGTAVVLPSNGKTLLVGGSHCYPNSFDQAQTITTAAFSAGTVTITTVRRTALTPVRRW